jgi:hypothetical protein
VVRSQIATELRLGFWEQVCDSTSCAKAPCPVPQHGCIRVRVHMNMFPNLLLGPFILIVSVSVSECQ